MSNYCLKTPKIEHFKRKIKVGKIKATKKEELRALVLGRKHTVGATKFSDSIDKAVVQISRPP